MSDRALTERMAWQARDPDGKPNMASLVDVHAWFAKEHMIDKTVPAARLADISYAQAAAQELGPFIVANQASTLKGCR